MSITQRIPDEERAVSGGERQAVERARRELNTIPKNYLDATSAPGVNDDSTLGYLEGSRWVDVTNDACYTCVDATPTAAVWVDNAGGGGGADTLPELTDGPAGYGTAGQVVATNGTEDGWEWSDAGTGDVTGPAGATAGNLPSFDDNTGKVLNDSGIAAADVSAHLSDTANPHSVTAAQAGAIPNPGGEEQGSIPYYAAAAWALLAHGDAEALLSSGGHGANPAWTAGGTAERGDVLYRGASAGWTRLAHGTAGQLYFTGGHGADPAWASNLYWDETNDRLGVGTASPAGRLHVTAEERSYWDVYGDSISNLLYMRRARGTIASPTDVTTGQALAGIDAYGYQSGFKLAGAVQCVTYEGWDATHHGAYWLFTVRDNVQASTSGALYFYHGSMVQPYMGTAVPMEGTVAAPTYRQIHLNHNGAAYAAMADLAAIGSHEWLAQYDTTAGHYAVGARIQCTARGLWSATNYGTYLDFYVTKQNATAPYLMARLFEAQLRLYSYATNGGFVLVRSNGTVGAESAVQSGETLGFFGCQGYGATAVKNGPFVYWYADENWTDAVQGSRMEFTTILDASATRIINARARNRGFWQICYTSAPADADADNSMAALYVDEAGKTLYAKVKLSSGTVKAVALGTWP